MNRFEAWQATGRAFSPADAEAMFGWDHSREDVKRVYVYSGPAFVEILDDDTVVYGCVAQESLQDAEEAAFQYLASQEWRHPLESV